jgi:hypothetical protein
MNKNKINKFIEKDKINEYLNKGWVLGKYKGLKDDNKI